MSNIKKIIKKILPDKLIYDYRIIQILPQYIRSKHKAAKISIPEFKMMSDEETVDCIIIKICLFHVLGWRILMDVWSKIKFISEILTRTREAAYKYNEIKE